VKTFIYLVDHLFIMIIHVDILTVASYVLAVLSAIIVGLALRIPLLPERPIRYSFTASIIFPTSVIALGLYAMVFKLYGFYGYEGIIIGIVTGIVSALFSKFLLGKVLPKPTGQVEGES